MKYKQIHTIMSSEFMYLIQQTQYIYYVQDVLLGRTKKSEISAFKDHISYLALVTWQLIWYESLNSTNIFDMRLIL